MSTGSFPVCVPNFISLLEGKGQHCRKRKPDKVGPDSQSVIFGRTQCHTAIENGRAPGPQLPHPVVTNFSLEHKVVKEPQNPKGRGAKFELGRYWVRPEA